MWRSGTGAPSWLALACLLIASGCEGREQPGTCFSPDPGGIEINHVDKVDLLFLVDNSNSMAEEQAALASELPRMIRILASGDVDEDGDNEDESDFDGIRDLNVGVITSDMGTGGHTVPTCDQSEFGDDGVLRTRGRTDLAGCSATYPNILNFQVGAVAPEDFATNVACVANVGTGGCGFEQQLEAILKALTPTAPQTWTSPDFAVPGDLSAPDGLTRPFFGNASPHGNVANDGFARDHSILAIISLTDEEDCSAHEPDLFDPASTAYGSTDLNLRCFTYPDALHAIERYVNGFVQLRERPQQLVFAPIVGIPVDLAPPPGEAPDWTLLTSPDCETPVRDPRLCERVDPAMENRLAPSCNVPGRGIAFPPVRILQVARELEARGAGVTVQSICQESYAGALDAVIRHVRSALAADCVSTRELYIEPDESVPCEVIATMPAGLGCELDGYAPALDDEGEPLREGDRAVCTIQQLVPESREPGAAPPAGAGWYYDTFTLTGDRTCSAPATEAPRVVFVGTRLMSGTGIRLDCSLPSSGVGTSCEPDDPAADPCPDLASPAATVLACDRVLLECGVACSRDFDCREAGLVGFVCDDRALGEVDPTRFPGDERTRGFCVDPTCS